MSATGILLTRLLPPRLPPDHLPRPALVTRLVSGMEHRLVTVLAGAGYGKSTAVALALHACPHPYTWVSCDERLGGAPDLLAHITAGVQRVIPGFGSRLMFDGSVTQQVTRLCNELVATSSDDLVVVLDDVHLLDPDGQTAVAGLVRDLPPSVHLVLAGRAPLPFRVAARHGRALEVTAADLALTEDEVAHLWAAEGRSVEGRVISRLRERTEGWVTGVVLAAQTGDVDFQDRADAAHLFAYLAEEVLAAQPRHVQDFLSATAILERFSPDLAGRVTGVADARAVCRDLVGRHLFTIRLDAEGEWYRYHHLFQAFLRDRLRERDPAAATELHRRAARAWLAEGQPTEAIDHLLSAGDLSVAADAVESVADAMRLTPQLAVLNRWIAALPKDLHAGRPALALSWAITTFAGGDPEGGFALLDGVIDDLLAMDDHDRAAEAFFFLIYAQLAGGTRQKHAIDVGYRQLPRIAPSAPLLPASMVLLAAELGCATRYDEADRVLGDVLRLRLPTLDPLGQGYLASARALYLEHPRGRSVQALATIDWVIDLFDRNQKYDTLAYILALRCYRAIILNQLGRYDETLAELDRVVDTALRRGITGGADRAMAKLRAVALAGLERWDELEALLGMAEPPDLMRGSSYGFRTRAPAARLAAHRGDVAGVARHAALMMDYVEAFGFSFDTPGWVCDVAVSAWQVGLLDDARRLHAHVLEGAERAQNPWARLRGELLGAVVLDGEAADRALADALELTREWGFLEVWTRRDRVLAGVPLARAIAADIGPPGFAATLAATAGGEVLERCAERLVSAPAEARQRLVAALDAAGVADPEVRARLVPSVTGRGARPSAAPVARPPLRIAALGGFTVRRGDDTVPVSAFGRERARALLGALVCAGGPVHREQLLDWLWPDLDTERGLRALHVTLHGLRRALEPELGRGAAGRSVVRAEGEGYRLVLGEADTVDVEVFLHLAEPVPAESPAQAPARLRAAERAHTGALYPEWPYAEWAAERRREVDNALARVLAGLGEHYAAIGDHREAMLRFERLVAIEPEREAFHRSLIVTYARAGEKALALRQYHACRAMMRRELGVEASAETRELYQRVLDDAPLEEPLVAMTGSRK